MNCFARFPQLIVDSDNFWDVENFFRIFLVLAGFRPDQRSITTQLFDAIVASFFSSYFSSHLLCWKHCNNAFEYSRIIYFIMGFWPQLCIFCIQFNHRMQSFAADHDLTRRKVTNILEHNEKNPNVNRNLG